MPSFLLYTHLRAHTHTLRPTYSYMLLLARNLYRLQSEKATTPQSGSRASSLMCTGCLLWLHSSEAPHRLGSQSTQICDTQGSPDLLPHTQKALFICFPSISVIFLSIMYSTWSNDTLSLFISTSTCNHLHHARGLHSHQHLV